MAIIIAALPGHEACVTIHNQGEPIHTIVWGVVKDGQIVPSAPLPEGARVEIRLCETHPEITPELQTELEGWQRASGQALELVERLARAK